MKKGIDFTGITIIYFCHDGNGNYLMNKRSVNCRDEQGKWDCGGGALEFGDSFENTIKREIKEEYNAEVIDFEFLGFRDVHRENNGIKSHWIALDFKVLVKKEGVKNGEPHKFDEIGWFKINEIPEPLHSQLKFTINKYKDKLITN